jgi:hypothetical protein
VDVLWFDSPDALREWVARNGPDDGGSVEAWIGFPRIRYGHGVPSLRVDAASAVLAETGWVPGERRSVDRERYAVRFAPGKVKARKAPAWANAEGPHPEPEFSREDEERFRADAEAWAFFEKQPPRYRRAAMWWVASGKSEETRERRITVLIEASAGGEKVAALARQM